MENNKKKNPKKINYILGVQSYANHDSGASILKFDNKGKILEYVAISEERLLRKKYPYTFPTLSIKYCMDFFNLKSLKEIDYIFSDWIRLKRWLRSGPAYNYQEFDYIKEKLNFSKNKVIQIDHHLAHAASTFYPSGFDKSSILIVDGNGSDLETNSYYIGSKNKIKLLEKYKLHGIGAAYTAVTKEILNMGTGAEGKTMGLAPYGKKDKKLKIKFSLKGISTNFSDFMRRMPYSDALNHMDSKFRPLVIKNKFKIANKKNIMNNYFSNWAFAIQDLSEKTLCHLGQDIKKKTLINKICLAGGVALNCVANQKLFKKNKFKDMFVFPACSDAGIPFGLVLWGYYNFFKGRKKKIKFKNAYTGRKYTDGEILMTLNKYKIKYKKIGPRQIAQIISKGKIVGNFWGGSEYGPRALGNRSLLADARDKNMRDYINKQVKHREIFRPFAPAILEEECQNYFDIDYSPFMLQVAKVKKKNSLPSAIHVDNTARVQTVNKEQNDRFYKIIEEFNKITGTPCILNTSFNDAGEPLVETPIDALICFASTKIDCLVLNNYLIDKESFKTSQILKKLKKDRSSSIFKNLKETKKMITKNFNYKEMNRKIKNENKIAAEYSLKRPFLKLKNFLISLKKERSKYLIVGTNDHTFVLQQLFKKYIDFSQFDYLELKKNDLNSRRNYKIYFKKIKKINNTKKYKKIIFSSFEYLEELKNIFKLNKCFYPYDTSSRSIMDFYFIKKNIPLNKINNLDLKRI